MHIDKEQLCLRYPFLKKTGIIHTNKPFNITEIMERWRNEKILILMVGVQGSGKTTYCKEHFSGYPVINIDELLIDYLRRTGNPFSAEANHKLNMTFLHMLETLLTTRNVAIVDAGSVHLNFRVLLLGAMEKKYTKVVLLVLNPSEERIVRQVKEQYEIRARPGLWQDILNEYELLQAQIQCNILEMGVDEIYML